MVNIDHLRLRKNKVRLPIQYAWCAATTRNFVGNDANKISKKEIVELDIGSLCDDILSEMSDSQERTRCTFYLSSMLTSGTVKIFQEQTNFILEDCEKLMLDLLDGKNYATPKKNKKRKTEQIPEPAPEKYISLSPMSMPTFDPLKAFGKKNVEDLHLMSELDLIDIPEITESFGFNPNQRELTDREIAELYREMIGENPQPFVTDDVPQDNDQPFVIPMHQEPADLTKNQIPQSDFHDPEQELMKTPKKPTHPRKSKTTPSTPSEAAMAVFSPPKKRSRTAIYNEDNNDMVVAADSTREPSLPGEVPREAVNNDSPVFDFRKRSRQNLLKNLERVMRKSKDDEAAIFDEPMLYAPVQQPESLPHIEPVNMAQVDLPEVSFHEPPPVTAQPAANSPTHSLKVTQVTVSDLSLGTLRSFEENRRMKVIKRGKKIFADRNKQIEIEDRPPKFMTFTRDEVFFTHALKKQSVDYLLEPASLKREKFLPQYRHWSYKLFNIYRERTQALTLAASIKHKAPSQKRKKRRDESRESSQQNREATIENMEVVQEQPQPSSPKNLDMNEQPDIEIPDHRAETTQPEDNLLNMETFNPTLDVIPSSVEVQTENPENQITNDAIHDEFEQPPTVEQVIEEPPLPQINEQVEAAMPLTKRFKSRDDGELENVETRSKKNLTVDQLFQIIQSFWNNLTRRDIEQLGFISTEFKKVVSPDYYNRVEAGKYLYNCFLLENEKKLYIQQKTPFDTIYLIKW